MVFLSMTSGTYPIHSQGGLRAVIWTDAFMAIVMFSTIVVLIITGTNAAGGFTYVWEINKMANRTDMFQ